MFARRLIVPAVVLLPVLSLAAACPVGLPARADGCTEGDSVGPAPTPPVVEAATATRPAPVPETLWTLDEAGRVRAADARANTVSVVSTVPSAGAGPVAGAGLMAGVGSVWVLRPRDGVATVVADGKTVDARLDTRARPFVWRDALWLAGSGAVHRVDRSGTVARVADLPADLSADAYAVTDTRLLLTDGRRLVSVDPGTGGSEVVPLGGDLRVTDLLVTPSGLVVTSTGGPTLDAVDPATGAVTASFTLPREELVFGAFAAGDDVWVVTNCGRALRFGTDLRVLDSIRISGVSQDFPAVVAAGSLWIGDQVRSDIVRIDLATHRIVARIPVPAADPDDPFFTLVAGKQSVWVTTNAPLRVDPGTNRLFHLGVPPPTGVPAAGDAVVAAAAGPSS